MIDNPFHYTQCGLDNIYLANGFNIIQDEDGEIFSICNIEGLHFAIATYLITQKKQLSGKEIRFLRHELLMSQATLANCLGVTEQTVHRWEKDKTEIPKSSELLLRVVYQEVVLNKNGKITDLLHKIANLEEKIQEEGLYFTVEENQWNATA